MAGTSAPEYMAPSSAPQILAPSMDIQHEFLVVCGAAGNHGQWPLIHADSDRATVVMCGINKNHCSVPARDPPVTTGAAPSYGTRRFARHITCATHISYAAYSNRSPS